MALGLPLGEETKMTEPSGTESICEACVSLTSSEGNCPASVAYIVRWMSRRGILVESILDSVNRTNDLG